MKGAKRKKLLASTAFTAVVVAVLVLVNVLFDLLTDRFGLVFDMTASRMYALSDTTLEVLDTLEAPVTVYIPMEEARYDEQYGSINRLLQECRRAGSRLTLTYVNVLRNPTTLSQFGLSSGEDLSAKLIVASEERHVVLDVGDMFAATTTGDDAKRYTVDFSGELRLTSALSTVTRAVLPRACLITGHGEGVTNGFLELLSLNNLQSESLNLVTDDLPQDTALVVISAPEGDYSAAEIQKLDDYLAAGGRLMVFMGASFPEGTALGAYFEEWGISFTPMLAADPNRSTGNPMQLLPQLAQHPLTEPLASLATGNLVVPSLRPVDITWKEQGTRTNSIILATSENAFAKPFGENGAASDSFEYAPGDPTGPFAASVLSEQTLQGGETARILFTGSPYIMLDDMLGSTSLINRPFLSAAVAYVCRSEDTLVVQPKTLSSDWLVVRQPWLGVLLWVLLLIPLGILAAGLLVRRKRRHL